MNSEEAYIEAEENGWSAKLEEIACKDPKWASYNVKGADIEKCQEAACKDAYLAYCFARYIKGANIEKCQEGACEEAKWAYFFAFHVKGANINKCQEAACKDPEWAYSFAYYIKGANTKRIRELCPEISDKLDELVMDRVLK